MSGHDTTADTLPNSFTVGGTWSVGCTCGWSKVGNYARDTGEAVALRLAGLIGLEHERNPLKEIE